jgi:ERAP1-like C-terminal domain
LRATKDQRRDFDAVKEIYLKGDSVDVRLDALRALGAISDLSYIQELLDWTLNSGSVKPQDMIRPLDGIASLNSNKKEVNAVLWSWCTSNWPVIQDRLSGTISMVGNVLKTCIANNTGEEFVKVVKDWAACVDCATDEEATKRANSLLSAKRPLEQGIERVQSNTAWMLRDEDAVLKWAEEIKAE